MTNAHSTTKNYPMKIQQHLEQSHDLLDLLIDMHQPRPFAPEACQTKADIERIKRWDNENTLITEALFRVQCALKRNSAMIEQSERDIINQA